MIITVSGPPGSGKTTVSKILCKNLNYDLVSGGDIFRKMANEKNMSIEEFSRYAEKDPEFDKKLDSMLLEILKTRDNIVVDSRLAGWLAYLNGIKAFKVFLNADQKTRLERISKRENVNIDMLKMREESEVLRYRNYYNIDFRDFSIYDLVINTDDKKPEEIVSIIIERVKEWNQ